jgi:hypothetical protein
MNGAEGLNKEKLVSLWKTLKNESPMLSVMPASRLSEARACPVMTSKTRSPTQSELRNIERRAVFGGSPYFHCRLLKNGRKELESDNENNEHFSI